MDLIRGAWQDGAGVRLLVMEFHVERVIYQTQWRLDRGRAGGFLLIYLFFYRRWKWTVRWGRHQCLCNDHWISPSFHLLPGSAFHPDVRCEDGMHWVSLKWQANLYHIPRSAAQIPSFWGLLESETKPLSFSSDQRWPWEETRLRTVIFSFCPWCGPQYLVLWCHLCPPFISDHPLKISHLNLMWNSSGFLMSWCPVLLLGYVVL